MKKIELFDREIKVREFLKKDIDNKIKWINDHLNNEYLHYDIPLEKEKTLNWFEHKDNTTRIDCIIEYNGIPVGLIGILAIDKKNRKAEIYITIGENSYKRKGIATRAIKLILEYAFNELNLFKIYLNVDEENIAACDLYEKIGFQCEGIFIKDMIHNGSYINRKRYAFFKEQYN